MGNSEQRGEGQKRDLFFIKFLYILYGSKDYRIISKVTIYLEIRPVVYIKLISKFIVFIYSKSRFFNQNHYRLLYICAYTAENNFYIVQILVTRTYTHRLQLILKSE